MPRKTFKDLSMEIAPKGGVIGSFVLEGEWTVYALMTDSSKGGKNGLWEIVVFRAEEKNPEKLNCFQKERSCGFLSFTELEEKLIEIQQELFPDPME